MPRTPQRVFLGWERACLDAACRWLIEHNASGPRVDLSRSLVVLPGGRARRTLLAMLAEACEQWGGRAGSESTGLMLSPPTIVTPGEVGDLMLERHGRVAPPSVRRLAWIEALRAADEPTLDALLARPPDRDDLLRWSALAGMLERRHNELTGELLLFEEVPRRARTLPDFPDDERWLAAGAVQRDYESMLGAKGLFDPSLQRLRAVREERPIIPHDVVLIGVPEINRATRSILERSEGALTALVFAPEALEDRFDEFGCVRTEPWCDATIDLHDDQILVADAPDDQADAALEAIASLDARYATDQVVIGVPDQSIVPYLRQRAERYAGVEIRYAGGAPIERTPVYRLLEAAAEFLETASFDALAALARHPDVERLLERRLARPDRHAWWLDEIDQYRAEHLQPTVDAQWLDCPPARLRAVRAVHRTIVEALGPLADAGIGPDARRRPILDHARALLQFLANVYAGVPRNRYAEDRAVVEACYTIRAVVADLSRRPDALPPTQATPAQAIRLVLEQVRGAEIPERPGEETIELLGWLELAMDPAPVVVVTAMNEGVVPSSIVADPLLPDALRRALDIPDDRRRLARDAYLLSAILASRDRTLLVTGRRNQDGDPLKPSRLLLRADPSTAARRFARLTAEGHDERRDLRLVSHLDVGRRSLFRAAPVVPMEPLESMSVTWFRTYLASPYEFYLKHVAETQERDDDARELDPAAFGNLLHDVLEAFAKSDARDSADPRRIEESVMDHLDAIARHRFGAKPSAPVAIQIELARFRLAEFATWQAGWAAQGWRIIEAEWRPEQRRAPFEVDDRIMWLRGKIDRVDRNEQDGRLAILDYKTGDNIRNPDRTHVGRDGWRDLQLPLYRHLAAELGVTDDATLGYVALPKQPGGVEALIATWRPEHLASADDEARRVVREIRAGNFKDVGSPWAGEGAIAALCGLGLIGAAADEDEEDEP